jgi:hypothetical protein
VVTDRFRATYFMSRHSGWCHKRTVEYVLQQSLDQVIELPLNERELLFAADSNPISAFLDCSNHATTNLIPFFLCLAIMKTPCPREVLFFIVDTWKRLKFLTLLIKFHLTEEK